MAVSHTMEHAVPHAVPHTARQTWTTNAAAARARGAWSATRWAARALVPVQLALAALFVAAGAAALSGAPTVTAQFGIIDNVLGGGAWLRTAAGVLEVVGGVLLCLRATAGVGAVLLGAVMAGAVLAHVFVLHTAPLAPLALGALLALVAYAHRAALAVVGALLERNL